MIENLFQASFMVIGVSVLLFAVLVIVIICVIISKVVSNNSKNSGAVKVTVPAVVVEKRTRYSGYRDTVAMAINSVTFELDNGSRVVLNLGERDFGYVVEGDRGLLTFKGRKFYAFERKIG